MTLKSGLLQHAIIIFIMCWRIFSKKIGEG